MTDRDHKANTKQGGNGKSGAGVRRRRKVGTAFCGKRRHFAGRRNPAKSYTKWIDYDIIKCGLCVRTRQSGDYLVIDDQGRRQKLKAWFINEKIPKEERDRMLLVADGSHIVWIPGYRMSRAYKVTEKTKNIVEIKITEEEKDGRNDQRDDFGRES